MSDNPTAALASLVCLAVAAQSTSKSSENLWAHLLTHVNLTAHGIIGVLHYHRSLGVDTGKAFPLSVACAKYLSLAGVNADNYKYEHELLPSAFAILGFIPIYLVATGKTDQKLGLTVIYLNLAALGYTAFRRGNPLTYYMLGAGILAFLVAPQMGSEAKTAFPLALAALDYSAWKISRNNPTAALASLVCLAVAAHSTSRTSEDLWAHLLTHVNLTAHGIIGVLHYHKSFGVKTAKVFPLSVACAKYLSLAGVNADNYKCEHELLPNAFAILGFIPVYLVATGKRDEKWGLTVIYLNLAALGFTVFRRHGNPLAFYTFGAGLFAFLVTPQMADAKIAFPLALAALDYCAWKMGRGVHF